MRFHLASAVLIALFLVHGSSASVPANEITSAVLHEAFPTATPLPLGAGGHSGLLTSNDATPPGQELGSFDLVENKRRVQKGEPSAPPAATSSDRSLTSETKTLIRWRWFVISVVGITSEGSVADSDMSGESIRLALVTNAFDMLLSISLEDLEDSLFLVLFTSIRQCWWLGYLVYWYIREAK